MEVWVAAVAAVAAGGTNVIRKRGSLAREFLFGGDNGFAGRKAPVKLRRGNCTRVGRRTALLTQVPPRAASAAISHSAFATTEG